jgi:hypothetical protein
MSGSDHTKTTPSEKAAAERLLWELLFQRENNMSNASSGFHFLVGLTVEEANKIATVREVQKNGQDYVVTRDYNPHRVNVATTDGKITSIVSVG